MPVSERTPVVTLLEGGTPLIPVPQIAKLLGLDVEIYVKYEGLNPTGSFKDRGMTMAITKALEEGSKAVICGSTGNTSARGCLLGARRSGLHRARARWHDRHGQDGAIGDPWRPRHHRGWEL